MNINEILDFADISGAFDTTIARQFLAKNKLSKVYQIINGAYIKLCARGYKINSAEIEKLSNGICLIYDDNGKVSQNFIVKNGQKDGKAFFFKDGILIQSLNYRNGLKHGICYMFIDKVLRSKGNYYNGEQQGKLTIYGPTGIKTSSAIFNNGITISITHYNENGKTISKTTFNERGEQLSFKQYKTSN